MLLFDSTSGQRNAVRIITVGIRLFAGSKGQVSGQNCIWLDIVSGQLYYQVKVVNSAANGRHAPRVTSSYL